MYKNLNLEALGISARPSEQIELTLSYGFKGFDLDIEDFKQQVDDKGLDHARRLIDSARLRLGSFRLPIDWDADETNFQEELARLQPLAEIAGEVGCKRCRATLAAGGDVRPFNESFELYRRRFAEIGRVLGKHDILLGVGFQAPAHYRADRAFQFLHTFDALLLLVKSVGVDNVGVALDTWHWHVAGGTMEQIEALRGNEIVLVDVADASTPAGHDEVQDSTRRVAGLATDGSEEDAAHAIDLVGIIRTVAKAGYDGPLTPVPHPDCFKDMRRDEIVRKVGEGLDQLWAAVGLNKKGKLVEAEGKQTAASS